MSGEVTSGERASATIRKIKLDGSWAEYTAELIPSPAEIGDHTPSGRWLYSAAGTEVRRSGRDPIAQPADAVTYVPTAGGFVAMHWRPAATPTHPHWAGPWISVDIADRITLGPDGSVSFRDLELDLWRAADGVGIVDQDELADAVTRGLLDPSTAAAAERTAGTLADHLADVSLTDAFGGLGWALLDRRSPGRDRRRSSASTEPRPVSDPDVMLERCNNRRHASRR